MSYTTLLALTERFGERLLQQLTDRASPPLGEIDASVIEQAIGDAEAIIDGYLAARYQLPLASVPRLVSDIALTVTIYKLHTSEPDKKIAVDFEQAMKTLREIANGTVRLDIAGVEPEAKSTSGVRTNDRERPFTEKNLQGFV